MNQSIRGLILFLAATTSLRDTNAFAPRSNTRQFKACQSSPTELCVWKNIKIPLLDVMDEGSKKKKSGSSDDDDDEAPAILTPLPSAHLPAEVSTPFLYGMQLDRPLHKLLFEEALAVTSDIEGPALYGHLVWKDKASDSLVGAIGCTGQILLNAPTAEVLNPAIAKNLEGGEGTKSVLQSISDAGSISNIPPSETPPTTVLCRGAFRFIVKEVVKTIPYPVAIVDEIQDDAEEDDSDMFAVVSEISKQNDDDEDMAKYAKMSGAELLQKTMLGIQAIVSQKLEEANSKTMTPLEKQILESSGINVDLNVMEQARAEEIVAVWEVFQASLVDDIEPQDRKFAVAIMGVELADMNNDIRQQVILSRSSEERLRIVLKELDEIVGMARARKLASQITEKVDGDDKDLKVGQPQLPPWAKTIVKGTRVEYFWNEEFGWVAGEVIQDPVTVVDEILLTIRFDDGETHTLPLTAEDKVRWRPPEK